MVGCPESGIKTQTEEYPESEPDDEDPVSDSDDEVPGFGAGCRMTDIPEDRFGCGDIFINMFATSPRGYICN